MYPNQPRGPIEFRLHFHPERAAHGLYMFCEEIGGDHYIAKPLEIEFEKMTRHGSLQGPGPLLWIDNLEHFTQIVYEEAERKGIKKEGEKLLEGKIIALEAHLDDMRKIAHHVLKLK